MKASERLAQWLRPAVYLGRNRLTLTGAVLTTSAALTLLGFWGLEIVRAGPIHPYAGIALFMILPAIFLFGLSLMPIGGALRRRALRRVSGLPSEYPRVDLGSPLLRRAALLVAALSLVNVLILGVATYRGVEYMDSTQFCGKTCHNVMTPEFTAHKVSTHSSLECVDCHIGSGASSFVRAKVSGVRQVFAVTLNTYSRPIPSPVHQLRPAREICERCHARDRARGERLVVRRKFADDEKNTPSTTVLLMKIGGNGSGIHGRHLAEASSITFESTGRQRQSIADVVLEDAHGRVTFVAPADPAAKTAGARERRRMDCLDCHNRPAHTLQQPDRALDEALAGGRISPDLPFVKKKALEALKAGSPGRPTSAERIGAALTAYYRDSYPAVFAARRADVESAVRAVKEIYERNVFPDMNVTWGAYPNNLGHDDFPGCFRCHDGNHKSKDGRVITAECDSCHTVLAQDEANPKILADLGLAAK